MHPGGRRPALALPAAVAVLAALLAVLVLVPLLRLVQVVGQGGAGPTRLLHSPGLAAAGRNTVVLAGAVTTAAVPIGAALALVLRRPDLPGRAFWRLAVL